MLPKLAKSYASTLFLSFGANNVLGIDLEIMHCITFEDLL